VGEFHYSRYPQAEWRDELLKMKAGGLNTVSSYVFWIHHEEEQGQFDWSGQRSLREFLKTCHEVGLKVLVRMGPWDHGEVRNGGYPDWLGITPDWVEWYGTKFRPRDPVFMRFAERLFQEQSAQMAGLLWKDGGPVIGVQLDNECSQGEYLLALKRLARSVGVDVPLYVVTGWQGWRGGIPKAGLLPLFGAYADAFWDSNIENCRKEFIFTDVRALNGLGAQATDENSQDSQPLNQFPYACVEIGPGMVSSYNRRVKIVPEDVVAMALTKLGSGNNMPGYYMYHGGMNPDGKLSDLNEAHPWKMPVKDYDFQTALGAFGQVREQFHLLRQQHLFLQDFGASLARMTPFFPDQRPAGVTDLSTLRWAVRTDGERGFLFFVNRQSYQALPAHDGVQFALKTNAGVLRIPRQPVTIPSGSYGIWPVKLDCDGVSLEYATAQPLCRGLDDRGNPAYLFTALPGIEPELVLQADSSRVAAPAGETEANGSEVRIHHIQAGTLPAACVTAPDGRTVSFVVLTPAQARQLCRVHFAGRDRLILFVATVLADGDDLRLQADAAEALSLSMFPPVSCVMVGERKLQGTADGIFTRFTPENLPVPSPIKATAVLERPASPTLPKLQGTNDETWQQAEVYKLNLSGIEANRHIRLDIHYIGDAARIYVGNRLFNDHYFNGDPISLGLWRIPHEQWPQIRLRVLPYTDELNERLPLETQRKVEQAKAAAVLNRVTISVKEQIELCIHPGASTPAPDRA
jgi:hypothetical protein